MTGFRDLPIFRPGIVGIFTQGGDAVRLTAAMKAVPEAQPAATALGDPFNRVRRAQALRILEGLPRAKQVRILAAYNRKRNAGGES